MRIAIAVFALVTAGGESAAWATCGDYLHTGDLHSGDLARSGDSARFRGDPPTVSLPDQPPGDSRCHGPACGEAPAMPPASPVLRIEIKPSFGLADREAGESDDPSCRSCCDWRTVGSSAGHLRRLDRPPIA